MNKKFRKGFVFGLALVFVAVVVMAAIPTHYITSLFVKNIKRLSENDTLTIGEVRYSTVHVGGQTLSGATPTNTHFATALLSGTTGDISWSAATSGASGWHLTAANMLAYRDFLVETQFPGGNVSSATPYSGGTGTNGKCPVGRANTGSTIYMPTIVSTMHNMQWSFTKMDTPVTPFVLYDANSRIYNVTSGSTQAPSGCDAFNANAGVTSIPANQADTVTLKAIFFPTHVSGYYVRDMYIYGN